MSDRLRFGAFVPPHHLPVNYNPTYALQRDTEIVQLMDSIGFDEAWIGEHHSGGAEPIGDPMMFIAHVAAQTKYIRLGTGVVSLPYHNPLWVADRLAMLDHLTRGRVMLGLGRALGETMAVTMLIGNSNNFSLSLLAPANTISSMLANQFGEADGLQVSALMYAALVLMLLTLVVNVLAQQVVRRFSLKY